ncbi:unnamed protein product [Ostreobium quekettii]|uniref:Uncharacterized protein n=1 Tax=Ostreobium quekettii TaxID=121088 RepID=A0A8S1IKH7_9CHLO|nr:unnamed protein product [Ostreobium quekettii]
MVAVKVIMGPFACFNQVLNFQRDAEFSCRDSSRDSACESGSGGQSMQIIMENNFGVSGQKSVCAFCVQNFSLDVMVLLGSGQAWKAGRAGQLGGRDVEMK